MFRYKVRCENQKGETITIVETDSMYIADDYKRGHEIANITNEKVIYHNLRIEEED